MNKVKLLYNDIFVASSISILLSLVVDIICSLAKIAFKKDIKLSDIMASGLLGLANNTNYTWISDHASNTHFYDHIAKISVQNYVQKVSQKKSCNRPRVVLDFQGNRLSAVSNDNERIVFYSRLICILNSAFPDLNYLIIEHRFKSNFAESIRANVELLSGTFYDYSSLPNVEVIFTSKLDEIEEAVRSSNYYFGRVGCDSLLALISGTPCTFVNDRGVDDQDSRFNKFEKSIGNIYAFRNDDLALFMPSRDSVKGSAHIQFLRVAKPISAFVNEYFPDFTDSGIDQSIIPAMLSHVGCYLS